MIKTAGANVSPAEVERAIAKVTGGRIAHVLGMPDAERGQLVAAVVVVTDGAAFDEAALRDRLRRNCRRTRFPGGFVAVSPSPISAAVQRQSRHPQLRKLFDA